MVDYNFCLALLSYNVIYNVNMKANVEGNELLLYYSKLYKHYELNNGNDTSTDSLIST